MADWSTPTPIALTKLKSVIISSTARIGRMNYTAISLRVRMEHFCAAILKISMTTFALALTLSVIMFLTVTIMLMRGFVPCTVNLVTCRVQKMMISTQTAPTSVSPLPLAVIMFTIVSVIETRSCVDIYYTTIDYLFFFIIMNFGYQ